MGRRIVAALGVAAVLVAACSETPRLAPPVDRSPDVSARPEPQIFASGTVMGGIGQDTPIEWDLEEIVGFPHAVSLTAATPTTISVRSVSRQGMSDSIWLVGTTLTPEGPAVVFGGADPQIDSIVLVNESGDELSLELIEVPELDWFLTIEQIPVNWSANASPSFEVVAHKAGREFAREELLGLSS